MLPEMWDEIEKNASAFWNEKWRELCLRLYGSGVPIAEYQYHDLDRADEPFMSQKSGVIFRKVRYEGKERVKTRWLIDKDLKAKKRYQLEWECQWTFQPLAIFSKGKTGSSKSFKFVYKMQRIQFTPKNAGQEDIYAAYIQTSEDGLLEKTYSVIAGAKEQPNFPYKIVFPKAAVAKMNRCLANNYLHQLWYGPAYAQWHFTDEGSAFYLGVCKDPVRGPTVGVLKDLFNSSCGESIAVLISYLSFSILKPFFPSYHELNKQSPYLKAKKFLPEQFAVNVCGTQSEVDDLLTCCCGYFLPRYKKWEYIKDGINIQQATMKSAKLSIDAFESKVLQSACVLWVNREPAYELTQDGRVIELYASRIPDDILVKVKELSIVIINILAQYCSIRTVKLYSDLLEQDWQEAIHGIKELLDEIDIVGKQYHYFTSVTEQERDNLSSVKDRFASPEKFVKYIRDMLLLDIEDWYLSSAFPRGVNKIKLTTEIKKVVSNHLNYVRKVDRRNRKRIFSLDQTYQKKIKMLRSDKATSGFPRNTINKIAFLSVAFSELTTGIEAIASPPVSDEEKGILDQLCKKVDDSLISVFRRQMNTLKASDILERYILAQMRENRCARIRGTGSDKDTVKVWYDPKQNILLLPSKSYFEDLKISVRIGDINKSGFEKELVQAGILYARQRGNQSRRTFEVKIKKQTERTPVLKIYTALLSDHFLQDAQVFLERMKKDETSYRS